MAETLDPMNGDECWLWEFQAVHVNPLRAKLFRGNINMHLHLMSFLHIDMPQIIETRPRIRAGLSYFT